MKPIGPEIKNLRVIMALTLEDVAKKAKITVSELLAIERAKKPSAIEIKKVCKAMNIPKETLSLFCFELKDVAKDKRSLFKSIAPALKDLCIQALKEK